jgi:NADH-quinone oxidoreductase subunit C
VTLLGAENPREILQVMEEQFAAIDSVHDGPPEIPVDRHVALAQTLREEFGYSIFGFIVATHYPSTAESASEHIGISYGLRRVGPGTSLASWQLRVPVGGSVPTLTHLFAGADWQEREQYDLLGVRFAGHPDLRRLMLSEDWNGHPLRKDYAIDTKVHPWR